MPSADPQLDPPRAWYSGITRYQWLVLTVASLGWIFDVFEGQIFVASMREAMPALLPEGTDAGDISFYNSWALAAFLVGGALGGVFFGALGDRIGRTKTMILTILVYSLFTCLTAFVQSPWQMAVMRFLVAMGVGGEWAVASAMIAEVMPTRARPWMSSIFHASSVFGSFLAILAGVFIIGNPALGENAWRWGFAIGAVPALLTLWIRWKLHEPQQWVEAKARQSREGAPKTGRIGDLFAPALRRNTILGVALATIGLATFWGVHIYGKNATLASARAHYLALDGQGADTPESQAKEIFENRQEELKDAEMMGMFLTTIGGGIGLVLFGAISDRLGRRGAFLMYHVGGILAALLLFQVCFDQSYWVICCVLPLFGFMTLGMHAGYAVYFPELYPTRLRSTGTGFCFNVGRLTAAPILLLTGWLQRSQAEGGMGMSLENAASLLSGLFLIGIVLSLMAPETRHQELPE